MAVEKSSVKNLSTKSLDVHSLSMLFPQVDAEDISSLAEDISKNGVVVPLQVWNGKVIDGKHRLAAAIACGMETVPCVEISGTEDEIVQYIWALNVPRRHMTKTQIAAAIVTIESKYPHAAKEIKKTFQVSKSMVSMVRALIAKWEGARDELLAGVPLRTIEGRLSDTNKNKTNSQIEKDEDDEDELADNDEDQDEREYKYVNEEEAGTCQNVTSDEERHLAHRAVAESTESSIRPPSECIPASSEYYMSENKKISSIISHLRTAISEISVCKALETVSFRCEQEIEDLISTIKCYKYVLCPRCRGDKYMYCAKCGNDRYIQQIHAPGAEQDE